MSLSASAIPAQPAPALDIARFLASQAIMLSLSGVPGIYVHSLFGSRNCQRCFQETGHARSLNREKFALPELQEELRDPESLKSRVFAGYRHLLDVRKRQPALHPGADQRVLALGAEHLIYYYYPRNLEDPDRVMGIMAKHLKGRRK